MTDSTYRVGVFLDLAAGRFRRGAKAAAKDTGRLGGFFRKAAGDASLMGRRVAEGSRGARREVRRTAEEAQRLGRTLRGTGRDGEQAVGRLTRKLRGYRTEMGLTARAAGRLRGGVGGVAGILGVGGGAFAVAAGLRRIMTTEQRVERLGIQAGRSTEDMQRLRKEVYATANLPEIRLDPSQLLAAVEAIVEKTGDLDFARDNLLLIAQSIQGSGGTGDALGRLSAELRKLGIADPAGVARALNLLTAQGKSGAFTLGNMAAQGERLFSAFSRLGYQGEDAVRQLGAISQMARQSTGSSEQAATAVEALLRTLSDAQKIDAIWAEFGVNVRDPTGAFRPLDQILKEVTAATGGDPTRLSGVFDAEAIRAISALMTARGWADFERFLSFDGQQDVLGRFRPGPHMLEQDAARMAVTTGAQLQETKTDVEDWMQENLTGPLGEVVTALTSFKDELLVGAGLLAGSWYAFRGLRAAGGLLWRLAGRGGPGGRPQGPWPGAPAGGVGPTARPRNAWDGTGRSGPTGRPNNAWSEARRQLAIARSREQAAHWEATRSIREAAARRSAALTRERRVSLMRQLSGRGPGGPRGDQVRLSGRGPGGPRGDQVRGSGRGLGGPRGDQVRLSGRGPGGPRGDQVRLSGRGPGGPRGDQVRLSGRGPGGPRGGPLAEARRQLALARSQAEAARRAREGAARRTPSLMRPEPASSGPAARPRNAPTRGSARWGGGLFRALARGLGPASAGAMMGLTAHDIATGAIPGDRVAPEVGGLMGGLAGSTAAAASVGRLTKFLPGPVRFGGSLLAGLAGWMGGESAGRAATDAVFDPGWVSPESAEAAGRFYNWLDRVAGRGPEPGAPEIGNWRGVGLRPRNRGRLDVGQNRPEVWEPALPPPEVVEIPWPPEQEPATGRNRGRLDIGRGDVTVTIHINEVNSNAADPREVAEEVADEIERRMRDRSRTIRDVLFADPSPESVN